MVAEEHKQSWKPVVLTIVASTVAIAALRTHDLNRLAELETPDYETVRPVRGTFVRTIPAAGEIRNYKPVVVHSDVRAWERPAVIDMLPAGAFVKKGDPVLILDASEFRKKLSKPTLAVIADNARYDKAQADEIIQKHVNARRTGLSQFNAKLAQHRLTAYEQGDYEKSKADLEGVIKRRRQAHEQALADLREARRLARVGIVKRNAVAAADRRAEQSEIEYQLAMGDISLLDRYQHPRTMAQLGMAADNTILELDRTELRNELETSIKRTWTLSFDKWRAGWQSQVDYWQSCIDACIVRAPKDGQVMYLNEHDRVIEVGKTVHYMQKLFTVSERTRLSMAARVSDRFYFSLRRGQQAIVSVEALADKQFTGKLTWMGSIPTVFSRLAPESKHHKVEILLDGRGKTISRLYPGMTATANIVVDSREDVLQLPTGAIIQHEDDYVVIVRKHNRLERQVVQIGASDDAFTEIVGGVEQTDDVVVGLPEMLRELADAAE